MAESGTPSKPSRYHYSRQRQHVADESPGLDQQPPSSPPDDAIARSKSRYHRKPRTGSASSPPETRPGSQQQSQPSELPSRYHSKHRNSPLTPLYQEQVVQAPLQDRRTTSKENKHGHNASPPAEPGARVPRRFANDEVDSDTEPKTRQQRKDRSSSNRRKQEHASPSPLAASTSHPNGELFPPPKPADEPVRRDGPPQSGQIRATQSMTELPLYDEEDHGCFGGLFKRKRGEAVPSAADKKNSLARPKTAKDEPITIRPGGGGIVPGIDAPISAVNAGDRQVMVECNKTRRLLAVTTSTTAADIIKSAATVMPERIEVKSAVLLENFGSVGVHRPLRRYEHLRDVMNSWDSDRQNTLIIVDPGTGSIEPELTITGAPKGQPEDQSWTLSYSQKVGKWEKRFVTLRSDGQVVCQKDADKAKDAVNICHLSDFDIYTPTADKVKKKIKPPKKQCYAIKSQQKTTMFESTHDFVHFFSTGDRPTGDSFYSAVQSWRSWYLVNVRGAGKKEQTKPAPTPLEPKGRSASNENWRAHRTKESMESHYQLGSFKPLNIDMDNFEPPPVPSGPQDDPSSAGQFTKSANQFDVNVSPERRTSTVKRPHPPVALSNKPLLSEDEPLANLNRSSSVSKRQPSGEPRRPDTSEFRDTGLLGRNYSQRRKEQSEKEQPFVAGPNLLNGGIDERDDYVGLGDGLQRQRSTRKYASNSEMKRSGSTRETTRGHGRVGSADLDRSNSRRQKPKPLIDLTPEYKEPPQFSKKGRGYKPEQTSTGGLINSATSPEDPLGIPNTTLFRNTSGQTYAPPSPHSPGMVDLTPQHNEPVHHARKQRANVPEGQHHAMPEGRRRAASSAEPMSQPQRQLSVRKKQEAFTGEGLLGAASNRQGWGTTDKGRGVIDGSRAGGKPLVDLTADSQFVSGSLLNKVERTEGIPAPVIDREKG